MNTAIIITGTICSGKSTLAKRIEEALNLCVLNENNPKHFFGIIERIKGNDFTSPVIIEHTDILNVFSGKGEHDISSYFDKKIIIYLNVADDILTKNINDRKLRGVTGDYLNVDMIAMKKEIESKFDQAENGYVKYIANINDIDDYEYEYKKINAFLSDCL